MASTSRQQSTVIARNRRARHDYQIEDTVECKHRNTHGSFDTKYGISANGQIASRNID